MPAMLQIRPRRRDALLMIAGCIVTGLPAPGAEPQSTSTSARSELEPPVRRLVARYLRALEEEDGPALRSLCRPRSPEAAALLEAQARLVTSYGRLRAAYDDRYGRGSLAGVGFALVTGGMESPSRGTADGESQTNSRWPNGWTLAALQVEGEWRVGFDLTARDLGSLAPRGYQTLPPDRIIPSMHALCLVLDRQRQEVRTGRYLSAADAYGVLNARLHGFGKLGPHAVAACIDLAGSDAPPAPAEPVLVVELHGAPAALGEAHGRQLGSKIRELFDGYIGRYYAIPGARLLGRRAAAGYERHILPEHMEEIRALAVGSGLEAGEVLLAQCFLDMTVATGCSTLTLPASAAPDGVARFARNLDFPSFNIADRYTVLLAFRPEGRYGFVSVGWPGMIGVLSGMNEHGLALANMEVRRPRRAPAAMPYTLLYRMLLERCRTVDEAVDLLERTPRQSSNNLMLMDASGARAVVEITPAAVAVRRAPETSALISTNHQRGADLDEPHRCRRFDYLHDASRRDFNRLGRRELECMLLGASQANLTMQSMIFEPAHRVVYLAVGMNAPRRGFERFDLAPFLGNPEGRRGGR